MSKNVTERQNYAARSLVERSFEVTEPDETRNMHGMEVTSVYTLNGRAEGDR
jgi:hypothetical protein